MRLELQRMDTRQRWNFTGGSIRLGRDPRCPVSLNDPEVSREHAVIVTGAAGAKIQDLNSSQGTWVNGEPVTEAELHDGDVLSLGPDGPQLQVGLQMEMAATVMLNATLDAPTVAAPPARGVPRPSIVAPTLPLPAPAAAARTVPHAARTPPPPEPPASAAAEVDHWGESSATLPAPPGGIEPEAWAAMQAKVNSLQRLLRLSLLVVVTLLAVMAYFGSQLNANAASLARMEMEAKAEARRIQPQVNAHEAAFDQKMNGLDADIDSKMKTAEDHMVARMNTELPRIMDAYIAKKSQQLGATTIRH